MGSVRESKNPRDDRFRLLARIDRQAAAGGGNRSAVERLLRDVDRDRALARLEESTGVRKQIAVR